MIRTYKFSFEQLEISVASVEKIMGYGSGESPDPFPSMIKAVLADVAGITQIEGGLYISEKFNVVNGGEDLLLDDTHFPVVKKISAQLKKSEGAALLFVLQARKLVSISNLYRREVM